MLSNEIWKPVVGYEELYEVSNKGRIKALKRRKNCNRGYGFIKEHIMKPNNHGTCDYYRVPLTSKEHIKKYYMVHRLVAKAFIENPNNLPEVNHKDGNKENNCVENLEWCDRSYNIRHALETGLKVTIKDLVNEIDRLNKRVEQLENIVKFAITNHIGNLRGGMQIERYGIDKMQDLRLSIDYMPENNSYIIRVNY